MSALVLGERRQVAVEGVGSMAIVGPLKTLKTAALLAMVRHALDAEVAVEPYVITSAPLEWVGVPVPVLQHCDRRATELVARLSARAEQRQYGREWGPVQLLIADHFDRVSKWDYAARLDLQWLVSNGAAQQVVVVAAINATCLCEVGELPSAMEIAGDFQMWANAVTGIFMPRGMFRLELSSGPEFFRV